MYKGEKTSQFRWQRFSVSVRGFLPWSAFRDPVSVPLVIRTSGNPRMVYTREYNKNLAWGVLNQPSLLSFLLRFRYGWIIGRFPMIPGQVIFPHLEVVLTVFSVSTTLLQLPSQTWFAHSLTGISLGGSSHPVTFVYLRRFQSSGMKMRVRLEFEVVG